MAACSVHLGRPEGTTGFAIESLEAGVAEPTVAEAVRQGLHSALRTQGSLGGERALRVTVLDASVQPVAGAQGSRSVRATLRVQVFDTGEGMATTVVSRSVDFVEDGTGAAMAASRAAAFEEAARLVGEDVAAWLQYASTHERPPSDPPGDR